MNAVLEVRKLPDGRIQARRADGNRLTDEDKQKALKLADAMPGITVADVLRVFPGVRVLTPEEAAALATVRGNAAMKQPIYVENSSPSPTATGAMTWRSLAESFCRGALVPHPRGNHSWPGRVPRLVR